MRVGDGGGLHRGTRGRRCGRENSASVSWVLARNRRARARHRLEPARPDPSLTDRTTALMTAAATRPDPIAPTTRQFEFAGGLARAQSVRLGPRAAGDVRPLSAPVLGGATAVAFPPPPPPLIACPSWRSAPGCRSGSRYRPPADTPAGTPTPARRWSRSPRAKERSTTASRAVPPTSTPPAPASSSRPRKFTTSGTRARSHSLSMPSTTSRLGHRTPEFESTSRSLRAAQPSRRHGQDWLPPGPREHLARGPGQSHSSRTSPRAHARPGCRPAPPTPSR